MSEKAGDTSDLFWIFRSEVMSWSPVTDLEPRARLRVPWNPTTFDVHGGVVAAGGQCGEIIVRNLALDSEVLSREGSRHSNAVVNCVALGDEFLPSSLFVASNDAVVSCLDLSTSATCFTRHTHAPINHCALSGPSGLVSLVGDTDRCEIIDMRVSPEAAPVCTLRLPSAISVCADFLRGGHLFAAGTQGRQLAVFDLRRTDHPLLVVHSTQTGTAGAYRRVLFSRRGPRRLLFAAEHWNRVCVLDLSQLPVVEGVELPVPPVDDAAGRFGADMSTLTKSIAGITLDRCEDTLYIGTGSGIFESRVPPVLESTVCPHLA